MKGVILDGSVLNPGDLSYDGFHALCEFDVFGFTKKEQVYERCRGKDIIITNKVPFDEKLLSMLPDLKYIGITATGYNIIDVQAAGRKGIAVTNVPSYSTDAVAQHVFAFILNISNAVALHDESVKRGEWDDCDNFCYWLTPMFELKGKTLGIIGLGNIGRRVAELAEAFGMNVLSCSPHSRIDGIPSLNLEDLLSKSDIVTLHCPLTDDNREFINSETLGKMRRGAVLINAARGGLVREVDVISALESGQLSYYCADGLAVEPPRNNSLSRHPRAIITPHIAWAPFETRRRLLDITLSNVKSFLEGGRLNRIV